MTMWYCSGRRVMFPDNSPCSRTTSNVPWRRATVPGRRLRIPDDVLCSGPKCNVPAKRLLFPGGVSCSWTTSCVPGRLFMENVLCPLPFVKHSWQMELGADCILSFSIKNNATRVVFFIKKRIQFYLACVQYILLYKTKCLVPDACLLKRALLHTWLTMDQMISEWKTVF
jgi:hypothetical protein